MKFVKCKNETEKLQAIRAFCEEQIDECVRIIKMFESDRCSSLDYKEEIHDANMRKIRFEKIVQIINADEFTSVMML